MNGAFMGIDRLHFRIVAAPLVGPLTSHRLCTKLCAPAECQEDTRRDPFKAMASAFKLGDEAPRKCLNTV